MQSLALISVVCIQGLLSIMQVAMVSSRAPSLDKSVESGRLGGRTLLARGQSISRILVLLQIVVLLVGIFFGFQGGEALGESIETWLMISVPGLKPFAKGVSTFGVVAYSTFIMVFFGQLLPRRLALLAPELMTRRVAPAIFAATSSIMEAKQFFVRILSSFFSEHSVTSNSKQPHSVTEDELKMIVEQGAEEGMLDRHEETMIKRILQFSEIMAQDLMTPRTKVVGVDLNDSDNENIERILTSSHSTFPVYRDSIDNLVGVVTVKKLLERLYRTQSVDVETCMTEPLFLPDSARADKVLDAMKKKNTYMAVLIDEFGGTRGVITASDIIRAVMGDVPQDSGDHAPKFFRREDGSILIDGIMPLFELSDLLELDFTEMEDVAQTLSGLIMHLADEIPEEGQVVRFGTWTFQVLDMDGNRIDKVLAEPIKDKEISQCGVKNENSDC
jgi:putative hemolysin